jgi:F-type H+-transporting ATPase subunit b
MLIFNLPLADLNDIQNNFENVGLRTGFTTQQFLSQCFVVLVLFLVLNQFAWKPVRTILEQRRKTIEDAMANADKIKRELARAEADRLSILQKANEKAVAIIADAEKAAVVRGEQKTQEAARAAEEIIKKAHEAAVLDHQRLLAELKREVGTLVIQTTEKVTGKVLTPDDQNRLNAETLQQLSANQN